MCTPRRRLPLGNMTVACPRNQTSGLAEWVTMFRVNKWFMNICLLVHLFIWFIIYPSTEPLFPAASLLFALTRFFSDKSIMGRNKWRVQIMLCTLRAPRGLHSSRLHVGFVLYCDIFRHYFQLQWIPVCFRTRWCGAVTDACHPASLNQAAVQTSPFKHFRTRLIF